MLIRAATQPCAKACLGRATTTAAAKNATTRRRRTESIDLLPLLQMSSEQYIAGVEASIM
jgi:hypothetical protein